MTVSTVIHHIVPRSRRFSPFRTRARDNNPLALGQIPSGLTPSTGSVFEPGRTVWMFPTPPAKLHFDEGAIITTARLVPLFWGEFWRTATSPSVSDIQQAIGEILNSPYLSEVMQYGFQSLTLDSAVIVIAPAPPAPTFSGDSVKSMVWDLIDDGRFPEPDDDGGRIVYMVFAPQGANYDNSEAAGAHNEASDRDVFEKDHAWVGWCDYSSLDGLTEIFTHELVETLTDPEPYGGWTVQGMPEGNNELVDACFDQVGVVQGYRVSAYYSERLKACVVPSFPHQYGVSMAKKEERISSLGLPGTGLTETIGFTEATKGGSCFSGGYEWRFQSQQRRVTLTATASGYIDADFQWHVNGIGVFVSASPGVPNLSISTPASTALDPLSLITTLPPRTVTARVAAGANVLVIESQSGQPAGDFDVVCTVSEKQLPSGYHTNRTDQRAVTITGGERVMDERFQRDLANCLHLQSVLARELVEQVVIPRIDLGDPPPVWTERAQAELASEAERQANEARFLAHFVERADADLAASLRQLADGVIAVGALVGQTPVLEA